MPVLLQDPDYHASFLWCLGSYGQKLRKISRDFNDILQNLISKTSTDELAIECDTVKCKIGNKLYQFGLI